MLRRVFGLVLVCATLAVRETQAVKPNLFNDCGKVPYCTRLRIFDAPADEVRTIAKPIATKDHTAKMTISRDGEDFELTATCYKEGMVFFNVDAVQRSNKPYFPDPSLTWEDATEETSQVSFNPAKGLWTWPNAAEDSECAKMSLRANPNPFTLSVSHNDEVITRVNEKDLFRYESPERVTEPESERRESFSLDFTFTHGAQALYGVPEHANHFALQPTVANGQSVMDPYRLYNLDVFEYELNSQLGLYGSVPYIIAHGKKRTSGIVWINSSETWVDVYASEGTDDKHTRWISESGRMSFMVLVGPTPQKLFAQFAGVFGKPYLPPKFALGYHQCRWNYNSVDDATSVDNSFDKHDIPYDVLWLDIEYLDGKRVFTWNPDTFGEHLAMQEHFAAKNRKMVGIIDPHIKRDDRYRVHLSATSGHHYVLDKNHNDYAGNCWPGSSSWVDFMHEPSSQYWTDLFSYDNFVGSTPVFYTWNDMNEPSVFDGPEVSMPKDNIHRIGDGAREVEHRDVHNIYGMMVHRATALGQIERSNNVERPFVLSRAFFLGTQRFGAIWTGDNAATWEHLEYSTPMLLTLGVTGIVFSGADTGGFFGDPEVELLERWYQTGVWNPFFRAHAHIDTKRREPWLFSDETLNIVRESVRMRYALLPYWYTVFEESSRTGAPIMRPLWAEFPADEHTFFMENQFMIGSSFLITPVVRPQVTGTSIYLPCDASWFDYHSLQRIEHCGFLDASVQRERIPVFLRGGSVVPRQNRPRRSSAAMVDDPYTLLVAVDENGKATGSLYADDGHTLDYQKGKAIRRGFVFDGKTLTCEKHEHHRDLDENFRVENKIERVVFMGSSVNFTHATVRRGDKEQKLPLGNTGTVLLLKLPVAHRVGIADDWEIQLSEE